MVTGVLNVRITTRETAYWMATALFADTGAVTSHPAASRERSRPAHTGGMPKKGYAGTEVSLTADGFFADPDQ